MGGPLLYRKTPNTIAGGELEGEGRKNGEGHGGRGNKGIVQGRRE